MPWTDILEPHGWVPNFSRGQVVYWRRPGKDRGYSAISDYDARDLFCNYSTSTGLVTGKGYSKFGLYAELNYGGDFKVAAKELAKCGYGEPSRSRAGVADRLLGLDEVAPFLLETLPSSVRQLVTESAAALVAPPDFIAVPLLVATGAAIGDALELELKPGGPERANLYAACVGDPGSKKSPSFRLALRPLYHVQARLRLSTRPTPTSTVASLPPGKGHGRPSAVRDRIRRRSATSSRPTPRPRPWPRCCCAPRDCCCSRTS